LKLGLGGASAAKPPGEGHLLEAAPGVFTVMPLDGTTPFALVLLEGCRQQQSGLLC